MHIYDPQQTEYLYKSNARVKAVYPTASIIPTKLASYFYLEEDDFDHRFDCSYNTILTSRGGWPYHFPSKEFHKIGIRAKGKYDGGNDAWLEPNNDKGWAVAFHGLRRDV